MDFIRTLQVSKEAQRHYVNCPRSHSCSKWPCWNANPGLSDSKADWWSFFPHSLWTKNYMIFFLFPQVRVNILMFQNFVLCYWHPKNENWTPWTAVVDMQHMTEKADHRMSFKKIVYQQNQVFECLLKQSSYSIRYYKGSEREMH